MSTSSVVLYDQLQEFMQRVMGLMHSRPDDVIADLDLTLNQAKTVFLLACAPEPLPISAIAEQVGLTVAAQGRVVDRLVKLSILERRESELDRRVKLVKLAPRGMELADAHGAQKAQALRDVVDQIPSDLCARLSEALDPILAGDHLRSTPKEVTA
ncbi:MarR family winged helix-turn-helix transcriptional regulator [Aeromicrobium alkaliterrae]|uniref:HTH marR-type domain-containing protein n=1 Tax=Aeromicrobium alkaliterrae TaxID=302168 RepID=A0ABN2JQG0_9ACTN